MTFSTEKLLLLKAWTWKYYNR